MLVYQIVILKVKHSGIVQSSSNWYLHTEKWSQENAKIFYILQLYHVFVQDENFVHVLKHCSSWHVTVRNLNGRVSGSICCYMAWNHASYEAHMLYVQTHGCSVTTHNNMGSTVRNTMGSWYLWFWIKCWISQVQKYFIVAILCNSHIRLWITTYSLGNWCLVCEHTFMTCFLCKVPCLLPAMQSLVQLLLSIFVMGLLGHILFILFTSSPFSLLSLFR